MNSRQYTDPRLARVYDAQNPLSRGDAFYLDLAGDVAAGAARKTVLDIGCGTGRLACEFAARGHRVIGADPAPAMLAIAIGRSDGLRIGWVESDAASLKLPLKFDLVVMTGHAFQALHEDEDIAASLANLRAHLAPAGRLAFETRNPARRSWENWTPEKTRAVLDIPVIGRLETHFAVEPTQGGRVRFATHFRFAPDDLVVTTTTLRYLTQPQVASALAAAGFTRIDWYGDWDRSPCTADSREIIAVAG